MSSIVSLDELAEVSTLFLVCLVLGLDDLSELGRRLRHLPRPQDALLPLHQ